MTNNYIFFVGFPYINIVTRYFCILTTFWRKKYSASSGKLLPSAFYVKTWSKQNVLGKLSFLSCHRFWEQIYLFFTLRAESLIPKVVFWCFFTLVKRVKKSNFLYQYSYADHNFFTQRKSKIFSSIFSRLYRKIIQV